MRRLLQPCEDPADLLLAEVARRVLVVAVEELIALGRRGDPLVEAERAEVQPELRGGVTYSQVVMACYLLLVCKVRIHGLVAK